MPRCYEGGGPWAYLQPEAACVPPSGYENSGVVVLGITLTFQLFPPVLFANTVGLLQGEGRGGAMEG